MRLVADALRGLDVFKKVFYALPFCWMTTIYSSSAFVTPQPDQSTHSTLFIAAHHAHSSNDLAHLFPSKTVYFGVNMGHGSTEWKYLVDTMDPDGDNIETPSSVTEGGPSWGVVFGYDVSKNFSIELQYMQFAKAHIQFYPNSPYVDAFGNSIPSMYSSTQAYSLSGKFFVQVGHTHLRAFAAVGAGMVKRTDPLVNYESYNQNLPPQPQSNYTGKTTTNSVTTPYLSSGLAYSFTRHWILEAGFQYYTGFGSAQLNPVSSFIPFAWDAYGRIAYQL